MIETGYFAKIKDYPETDMLICVSWKYPWFVKKGTMKHWKNLSPQPILLDEYKNGNLEWNEFASRYRTLMKYSIHARRDIEVIKLMSEDRTVRLMCWEKGDDGFCHRFILQEYIKFLVGAEK